MSVVEKEAPNKAAAEGRIIRYTPIGQSDPVELSMKVVRAHIAVPTRSGIQPTDGDLIRFMMLCKQALLDPWVGDAFLVGYDTKDGPAFNLITAVQALLKRTELSREFDGIESGLIVRPKEGGEIEYREGTYFDSEEETLIGGWARIYRKDRTKPFYVSLKRSVYDTLRSRWAKDPGGMIEKYAIAATCRKAFPNIMGGIYTREEMDHVIEGAVVREEPPKVASDMDALAEEIKSKQAKKLITDSQVGERLETKDAWPGRESKSYAGVSTTEEAERPTGKQLETVKAEGTHEESEVEAESSIVTSFREQIDQCESEEDLEIMRLSVRQSKKLLAEEKKLLERIISRQAGKAW